MVKDDGVTAYAAPMTEITTAVSSAGTITINGTNLGTPEVERTVVQVVSADETRILKLHQRVIQNAGGSISAVKIVLPASLLSGLGVAGTRVRVQYTSFATSLATVT